MSSNETILTITETRGKTARWQVRHNGVTVADVRRPRMGADVDTSEVTAEVTTAIANHFGVPETAISYRNVADRPPVRYLPQRAVVTTPRTCLHTVADVACDLRTCEGTPPVGTPLTSRVAVVDDGPMSELGVITEVREITGRVERDTGLPVTDAFAGDNGWVEQRTRQVDGYQFTAGHWTVRALIFEGRESRSVPVATFTAVYVGDDLVLRDRYVSQGRVVTAIVEHLDRLVDERTMSGHDGGWVWLKHPKIGWQVLTEQHGLVTITEASSNDGFTLRVTDGDGVFRFVDRPGPKRWYCAPAGAPMPDGEGEHEVAPVARTEVAGVPVETIQAQTPVTHVEVDGVVVAETTRVDLTPAGAPVVPRPGQVATVRGWSGATVFVTGVDGGHVVGIESGGTVARVSVDRVTGVDTLTPDAVAEQARAYLMDGPVSEDVRAGLEALAVLDDPADWAALIAPQDA